METTRGHTDQNSDPGAKAAESAAVAELRHQFRNQIQTMTSLVGLFGDRMEPGPARAAFLDLRARLEVTAVMHSEEFVSGNELRCDAVLAALARRVAALYDPASRMTLQIETAPFAADPKRAATIAQLFAEMLIEFFRSGVAKIATAPARIFVGGGPDGALRLTIAGPALPPAGEPDGVAALGHMIMDSLAHSLGGGVSRGMDEGFSLEATAPGESRPA
jgi:two-component sensor histidine kinase